MNVSNNSSLECNLQYGIESGGLGCFHRDYALIKVATLRCTKTMGSLTNFASPKIYHIRY